MTASNTPRVPRIESRIQVIRGLRVMLDVDLAALYGVQTKRLNEQVKRNRDRFPSDFLFQLTADEKTEVVANCDHLQNLKFSKALPFAFTEHGAIQAANVLASSQAVEMGIYVVRAFVQLRQALTANADIAKRLAELEMKTASLEMSHDNFSRNTRERKPPSASSCAPNPAANRWSWCKCTKTASPWPNTGPNCHPKRSWSKNCMQHCLKRANGWRGAGCCWGIWMMGEEPLPRQATMRRSSATLTRSRNAHRTIGPNVEFAQLTGRISDPAP